jgi:hypothetical protein
LALAEPLPPNIALSLTDPATTSPGIQETDTRSPTDYPD